MIATRTALIVGAGIGGLAAAVALRRTGWRVRVFERAAHLRELGFALNLAPNAMVALRELGLAERLLAEGATPERVELRTTSGQVLRRLNVAEGLGRAASVVALRPVLHGALIDALNTEDIEVNSEAVGVDVTPSGAALALADGRSAVGDVLVGADGIGSTVRRVLHPQEAAIRRSGYYGVRGVAHQAAGYLGDLSAVGYFGTGIEAAAARAGGASVYWYMSLLADDVPADTGDACAFAQRCGRALDETFQRMLQATQPEDVRVDALYDREPLDVWGRGPVTLLGDAAHPMLPHAGQGAAQALEDAVALALALARDPGPSALRRYEQVRSARTARIVRLGRRIARVTTTRNPAIKLLRSAAIRFVPASVVLSAYFLGTKRDPHRALR